MIKIPLTQGKFALIDDEDFELVNQFKWYVCKHYCTYYAISTIKINGKKLKMHRFILDLKDNEIADHADTNGLNNQRHNLRKCTFSQNLMNMKSNTGLSRYKGVCWHKRIKKWQANIAFNKKQYSLGYRDSEIECAKLYDEKAKELSGEFARLNFNENIMVQTQTQD